MIGLLLLGSLAMAGDLDFGDVLARVNLSAEADFGAFKARLSTDFGKSSTQIEVLVSSMPTPADAYMCLKVAEISHQPLDTVTTTFNTHRNQGWGAIAKELGIKPGSSEFHALKSGNFESATKNNGNKGKGHGKSK